MKTTTKKGIIMKNNNVKEPVETIDKETTSVTQTEEVSTGTFERLGQKIDKLGAKLRPHARTICAAIGGTALVGAYLWMSHVPKEVDEEMDRAIEDYVRSLKDSEEKSDDEKDEVSVEEIDISTEV